MYSLSQSGPGGWRFKFGSRRLQHKKFRQQPISVRRQAEHSLDVSLSILFLNHHPTKTWFCCLYQPEGPPPSLKEDINEAYL